MTEMSALMPGARPVLSRRTPYQRITIAEHPRYGHQLYIDDDLQISSVDHAYGAAMVAPLIAAQPLEQVMILGGGDGGVLAELLRLADEANAPLERALMVDIDAEVVDLCQHYLPGICGDAFDDPRSELVIGDALAELEQAEELDAIVYDLTLEPFRENISRETFVEETIDAMASSLRPGGIISMQCCGVGATTDGEPARHRALLNAVREAADQHFEDLIEQQVVIPSYEGLWTFLAARKAESR